MKILIDTREQLPFKFDRYGVQVERGTLPVGDYSIPGFEDRVSIERKSLDDLIGCLMGKNRVRFERELCKGTSYEVFNVVIEAPFTDLIHGRYQNHMRRKGAVQSVMAFAVRYRTSFVSAGSRPLAEHETYSLSEKFIYEIRKRYQIATGT